MMDFYNKVCDLCSKKWTNAYSTSFSLGIKMFDPSIRTEIYGIYGFVRLADEIVDTFHEYDKKTLLDEIREEVKVAIERGISLNPIIQSYQNVVNQYDIPWEYTEAFLDSMEMDLYKKHFTQEEYDRYIYGSAEVIGLMCLKIFTKETGQFSALEPSARSLGAAFQKVNFLRDIKSDYEERGRVYFPGVRYEDFDCEVKRGIEDDIQNDFNAAAVGLRQLPESARLGVAIAFEFYNRLFCNIKSKKSKIILEKRVRVPNKIKLVILAKKALRSKLGLDMAAL